MINEVMASRVDPPVEVSPSVKLIKQHMLKEKIVTEDASYGYRSLYGEHNPKRNLYRFLEANSKVN